MYVVGQQIYGISIVVIIIIIIIIIIILSFTPVKKGAASTHNLELEHHFFMLYERE